MWKIKSLYKNKYHISVNWYFKVDYRKYTSTCKYSYINIKQMYECMYKCMNCLENFYIVRKHLRNL